MQRMTNVARTILLATQPAISGSRAGIIVIIIAEACNG